jgi:hypothetical protein
VTGAPRPLAGGRGASLFPGNNGGTIVTSEHGPHRGPGVRRAERSGCVRETHRVRIPGCSRETSDGKDLIGSSRELRNDGGRDAIYIRAPGLSTKIGARGPTVPAENKGLN